MCYKYLTCVKGSLQAEVFGKDKLFWLKKPFKLLKTTTVL